MLGKIKIIRENMKGKEISSSRAFIEKKQAF